MERMIFITILRAVLFLSTIFIVQFYFAKRLRKSLLELGYFNHKRKLTISIVIILLFFNLFPIFNTFVGIYGVINPATDFEIPKIFLIDYLFRIPSWLVIVIIVQVVILSAPIDFIYLLLNRIKIKVPEKLSPYLSKYFLVLLVFFICYIPLRAYYEHKKVVVEKRTYQLNTVNSSLEDFRIVFISDIQADRFTNPNRVKKYISKINEVKPDLVLAGGDFVTGDSNYIPIISSLVQDIRSNYGVYSCIGDHDFFAFKRNYWRSINEVKNALEKSNVKMIDDGNLILIINESKLKITFLSNTYVKSYNEMVFDSLASTSVDAELKILVTHQPDEKIALKAKEYGYNIYLSGHTHGGQVNFLFPFLKLTPVMFETNFISGDYWFDEMLMIVNRGLGMSTIPFRYHSIPEVTLIEINTKAKTNPELE